MARTFVALEGAEMFEVVYRDPPKELETLNSALKACELEAYRAAFRSGPEYSGKPQHYGTPSTFTPQRWTFWALFGSPPNKEKGGNTYQKGNSKVMKAQVMDILEVDEALNGIEWIKKETGLFGMYALWEIRSSTILLCKKPTGNQMYKWLAWVLLSNGDF